MSGHSHNIMQLQCSIGKSSEFYLLLFFLDDVFLPLLFLAAEPVDEEALAFLAGIFKVAPARRASELMPLAAFSSAMETPYFFEIDDRVSPLLILCEPGVAAFAVCVLPVWEVLVVFFEVEGADWVC